MPPRFDQTKRLIATTIALAAVGGTQLHSTLWAGTWPNECRRHSFSLATPWISPSAWIKTIIRNSVGWNYRCGISVLQNQQRRASEPRVKSKLARRDGSFLQNLFDSRNGGLEFLICVVEMRRHPHPGFGAPIHQDVALQKFTADFARIRHIDRYSSATFLGIARGIHSPSVLVGKFDEPGSLMLCLFANAVHADFRDDLQPRCSR